MSLLVRKINKAKWFQVDLWSTYDVSADAITNCLKTSKNTLSVWKIETENDLDQAVLALVSNQDNLDTIDVVILDESSLVDYNVRIISSPGNTPIESLTEAHRDLSELSYTTLGIVKDHIVSRIRNNYIKRYTVGNLKKLLKNSIEQGLLKKEDLQEGVQKKI